LGFLFFHKNKPSQFLNFQTLLLAEKSLLNPLVINLSFAKKTLNETTNSQNSEIFDLILPQISTLSSSMA